MAIIQVDILAAMAQFDNDVRSERVVAGLKAAIERGPRPDQPSRPPAQIFLRWNRMASWLSEAERYLVAT